LDYLRRALYQGSSLFLWRGTVEIFSNFFYGWARHNAARNAFVLLLGAHQEVRPGVPPVYAALQRERREKHLFFSYGASNFASTSGRYRKLELLP